MKNEKVVRTMKQIVKEHPEMLRYFKTDLDYDLKAAQQLKPGQVAVWMLRETGSDWIRLGSPNFLDWLRAMTKHNELAYYVTTAGVRQTTLEAALKRGEAYADSVPTWEFRLGSKVSQVQSDSMEEAQKYFLDWVAWSWAAHPETVHDKWVKEGQVRQVS